MKKGLFSILASALLVVGCQNYDDQFDNLETQINALASVVAGLSQVQSDITSLSGTVASLQSSVAGTVATAVDTALADGLANIDTAVAALEDATATAASSADVQAIADAVAAQATDLDELLANSSVFTGPVSISSVATLNAFHAMGSSLNIVNGDVTIKINTAMDATPALKLKVQELVNSMLSITGDLSFIGTSTSAMPTFLNLTGVASITIKGAGDYRLDNIVSAGNIILDNSFKSKVTIVHLGALTTYLKLSDQALAAGTVSMGSATEFHLTSLAVPAGGLLNLTTKKDSTVALTALTGLNSLGTTQVMTLAFNGAKDITFTNIKDGTIALTNVQNVNISDFYGSIDVNAGVENLTITKGVTLDMADAADLITATINMVTDYDPLLTATALATATKVSSYKNMTFASQDLTTAIVSGKVKTLTASATNNLTSLTVNSASHVTSLVVTGNNDLETLKVTGATIGNVTVDNNDNMITLTLDHTSYVTTADTGVTMSIDDNADLEGLTINANKIDDLSIQRNIDLVSITAGAKLLTTGSATATVAINNNNLTALIATDAYQAASTAAAPVVDAGTYDDGTSGMKTFKTYFGVAAAAPSKSGVKVFFDVISSYSVQGSSATAAYVDTTVPAVTYVQPTAAAPNPYSVIFSEKTNAAITGRSTLQAKTFVLPVARDVNNVAVLLNTTAANDAITVTNGTGGSKVYTNAAAITTVDQLVASINGSTVVPGLTISADRDGFHEQVITVAYTYSNGLAASSSATIVSGEDKIYFTYGTNPETGLPIAAQAVVTANSASGELAIDFATALNAAQDAYTATGTVDGKIRIVAQVSNTIQEDRGPIGHPFQVFAIDAASPSTTLLLGGKFAAHILSLTSSSNTTAIASGLFYFTTPNAAYSGARVTVQATNKLVSLASMGIATGATSAAFQGKGTTATPLVLGKVPRENAIALTAGVNIVAAAINSSSLDYVAAYADVENTSSTSNTNGTTIRVSWLGI